MEKRSDFMGIQGHAFSALAEKYGTPLYLYDGDKILSQIERLRKSIPDVQIKYAVKALTNQSILKLMKSAGIGVDVVSPQEAQLAMKAGYEPKEIMFTPNCVSFSEIEQGVASGFHINLDNLVMLEKFGKRFGSTHPCALRINPHILAGGNIKISTGHKHSKFGISIEQSQEMLSLIRQYKIDISGLHIHTGSELLDLGVFQKMSDILFDLARQLPSVRFLDFGGGLKVAYKPGEAVTDIEGLGRMLSASLSAFAKETGRSLGLWMEPGKFLVSEAGYLIARTNVVKQTPHVTFAGIDTGLNQLIRPMMYDAYHEIINVSNPNGAQQTYTIVGNVCETDTFAKDRALTEVREGDLLVILNAGAYGYTMASNYNSRPRPAEVLVLGGKAGLIRERDTLDQMLLGQVDFFAENK